MKKISFGVISLFAIGMLGCAHVPFQSVPYVSVAGKDPVSVRMSFEGKLPEEWKTVESAVFSYRWREFVALGYTKVNRINKTFSLIGMSPAGMKLFDVNGDAVGAKCSFVVDEFTKHGDFCSAVAADIRRVYFNRIPAPDAAVRMEKKQIVYREVKTDGVTEYVFAGEEPVLVEKRFLKGSHQVWRVRYYEYQTQDGKLFPKGIIFEHRDYKYRLTLRLKELLP